MRITALFLSKPGHTSLFQSFEAFSAQEMAIGHHLDIWKIFGQNYIWHWSAQLGDEPMGFAVIEPTEVFLTRASYRAQPEIFKKHIVSIESELIFLIWGFDLLEKIIRLR